MRTYRSKDAVHHGPEIQSSIGNHMNFKNMFIMNFDNFSQKRNFVMTNEFKTIYIFLVPLIIYPTNISNIEKTHISP